MSEPAIKDILYRLNDLVSVLEGMVGRKQHSIFGMTVGITDTSNAVQLIVQIERLLEKYSSLNPGNADDGWQTLISSYDPESRRILEVYSPYRGSAQEECDGES